MKNHQFLAAATLLLAVAACESSGPDRHPVDLSFSSQGTAESVSDASAASGGVAADQAAIISVTIGPNTLIINRARLVLRDIRLKPTTAACSDDDASNDDCETVHAGPVVADLPLTETAVTEITASVPEGSYRRIQIQIHKLSDDAEDAAVLAENPELEDASIRVEGTWNGQPFVYLADYTENVELEFTPAIDIDTDDKNVTVQADISGWFVSNGSLIDPRTANKGGANENVVRNNIRASLRAIEDDYRDGR